jgi:hypothetical protein
VAAFSGIDGAVARIAKLGAGENWVISRGKPAQCVADRLKELRVGDLSTLLTVAVRVYVLSRVNPLE